MVGTDHAILRCGRDPSLLGGRDHGPSGPKRPSASLGTPLLERGMCVKTRHLYVRVLRTHPYRGGPKDFRDESHEFARAIEPRLGGASDDVGGSRNRAGGRQGTPLEAFRENVRKIKSRRPPSGVSMACWYICRKLGTRVHKTGTRVHNSHFLLFHACWSVFMEKHTSPRANGAQTTPHAHTSEPCAPNATHGLRARLRGQWYVPIAIIIIHNHTTSPSRKRE